MSMSAIAILAGLAILATLVALTGGRGDTAPAASPATPRPQHPPRPPQATIDRSQPAPRSVARVRTQAPAHAGAIRCPDMLALVAFDHDARVVTPFVGAFDARFAGAAQSLPGLVRGGLTDMAAGLAEANRLLAGQPRGLMRRIWLLSDGYPNPEGQPIWREVDRARAQRTNINCVGIGDPGDFDRALLQGIAKRTHNGRYLEVNTLEALGAAFRSAPRPATVGAHRGEATVFVIDVSGSMISPMGAARRIDAVAKAMINLIRYKQQTWS